MSASRRMAVVAAVSVAAFTTWQRADAAVDGVAPCVVAVEPGDTLYGIAEERFGDGERWPELAALNPELVDPDRIEVGQALRVCSDATHYETGEGAEYGTEPLPRYVTDRQRWVTTDDGTPWPGVMTPVGVAECAWNAGWRGGDLVTAVAVARGESAHTPGAQGDVHMVGRPTDDGRTWGLALGLFQVLSIQEESGTGNPRDAERLVDPAFNCAAAHAIWQERGSWAPWYAWQLRNGQPGPAQNPATIDMARQAVDDLFNHNLEPSP